MKELRLFVKEREKVGMIEVQNERTVNIFLLNDRRTVRDSI